MFRKYIIFIIIPFCFIVAGVRIIPSLRIIIVKKQMEKLALRPPMGWNGWNHFRCSDEVGEQLIKDTVNAMVNNGMKDAGYEYVVLDDCWQVTRDKFGNIIPDKKKFPHGMKSLGKYIHSKGLKYGIYTSAGRITCEGRPGSFGFENNDVLTYASWGVDYIKVDWCGIDYLDTETQYKKWRTAIEQSGRPMVLSIAIADINNIKHNNVWEWGQDVGHLWRTTRDILDYWPDVLRIIDQNSKYARYSRPNNWNDADMLQVGNGGMSLNEYKSHFSLWAMMSSPLFAGNDITRMNKDILNILTNHEVISINQDLSGIQGTLVGENMKGLEIWMKPLADPTKRAVALFNRTEDKQKIQLKWSMVGLASVSATLRDLWKHEDIGEFFESYETEVPVHGVKMLLMSQKMLPPH